MYDKVLIAAALGLKEPHGRLPITAPLDMNAVEAQLEDVGMDTTPYVDTMGNTYSFGFGLNWRGRICSPDQPNREAGWTDRCRDNRE